MRVIAQSIDRWISATLSPRPLFLGLVCLVCLFPSPDSAAAATRTWDGGGVNSDWTNPANWVGNNAPDAGDALVFPVGFFVGPVQNNYPSDTEFASLTIAPGYTIAGNRFTVADAITLLPGIAYGEVTITAQITLKSIGGDHTVTMQVPLDKRLILNGVIHGAAAATLRKEGAGDLALGGANVYLGPTIVAAGEIELKSVAGLGSNTKGTTTLPGGMLELLVGGGVVSEPLALFGDDDPDELRILALLASEDATLSGPITLQGLTSPVIAAHIGSVTLTLSGVISGVRGVDFLGRGSLVLSGPASNTYSGRTTIWLGAAVLSKSAGAIAVPAGLTVGTAPPNVGSLVRLTQNQQIQGSVIVNELGVLQLEGHLDTIGALTLAGGLVTTGAGELTLGGNITALQSAQTARIQGKLGLGSDSRTIFAQSTTNPAIEISAAIGASGGFGLIKNGPGAARLSGANAYTGLTVVQDGTLYVAHPLALGGATTGTALRPTASLVLETTILGEPLYPEAAPNTDGPLLGSKGDATYTWGGNILMSGGLTAHAFPGSTLRLNGIISGIGSLKVSGAGATVVELGGANSYLGKTVIAGVELKTLADQRIPDASRVELLPLGTLNINGHAETVGGIVSESFAQVAPNNPGVLTVVTKAGETDVYSGAFTGHLGDIIKSGAGTWVIAGASPLDVPIKVSAGTLRVNGPTNSIVTLAGGNLEGTGKVGGIGGTSGKVFAGAAPVPSPGILHTKSILLNPSIPLTLAINGPALGTDYAQLDVIGTVNLNNAPLALAVGAGFVPGGTGEFIIVANDSNDPVIGTFNNLPEGATIDASNGRRFHISYVGGSGGNDVVLTTQAGAYYLSEGATGEFFDLDILIANPNDAPAPVTLTFLREDGATVVEHRTVPPQQRITVRVDDIAGVEATAVSTVVQSDTSVPLVVERTMRWDKSGYGAHTEKAAGGLALNWYFAEGSQGFFSTYLLLANPGPVANLATVQYLREGAPAIVRTYPIGAASRYTVDASTDPALVNTSFGMIVTFDQPGMAERAMYFGTNPIWKGGHESAGVTAPSTTWFLAEGATGPFFETFVLIANPNDADAQATLTFLSSTGAPITREKTVPARGRVTVNIEGEDAALENAAVSTQIAASLPVIVERAQYWPDPAPQWYEAHNSFGVTATGMSWGLAEGRAGGPEAYQTYILIANPGAATAHVSITFLLEGGAPIVKQFTVPPTSRFNVTTGAGSDVPELANRRFGARLTSDQPIVVERAMYSDAGGQTWAAGTNATATRLP